LNEDHTEIQAGTLDTDYYSFFHSLLHKISQKVPKTTQVVFVPSAKDIHHHCIFPQVPYQVPDIPTNWEMVSNPSLVQIDPLGIQIGVCSADILMDLSRSEFSKTLGNVPRDRMAELAIHLLQQQSFYPLFPVPQKSGLNLDDTSKALSLDIIPDLLILPSALASFAKVPARTDCICINPGYLTKGDSAGTFSKISVHKGTGPFCPRTRVEVVRL
jgi:DNA polymerase alpha subunit B